MEEEHLKIKYVRLRNLEAAQEAVVNHALDEALDRLTLFTHSVDKESEAYTLFSSKLNDIKETYDSDYNNVISTASEAQRQTVFSGTDPCEGLPPMIWQEEQLDKLQKQYIIDFHRLCWDVSFRYGLIPFE